MKCSKCGHRFCWVCAKDYNGHGEDDKKHVECNKKEKWMSWNEQQNEKNAMSNNDYVKTLDNFNEFAK